MDQLEAYYRASVGPGSTTSKEDKLISCFVQTTISVSTVRAIGGSEVPNRDNLILQRANKEHPEESRRRRKEHDSNEWTAAPGNVSWFLETPGPTARYTREEDR